MTRREQEQEPEDFSHLEGPLNMAIRIYAKSKGRVWDRTIQFTRDARIGEVHVGDRICRVHPEALRGVSLDKLFDDLFRIADNLERVRVQKRAEQVVGSEESVKRNLNYLHRVLPKPDYKEVIERLRHLHNGTGEHE